jgi:hypothetical protein
MTDVVKCMIGVLMIELVKVGQAQIQDGSGNPHIRRIVVKLLNVLSGLVPENVECLHLDGRKNHDGKKEIDGDLMSVFEPIEGFNFFIFMNPFAKRSSA